MIHERNDQDGNSSASDYLGAANLFVDAEVTSFKREFTDQRFLWHDAIKQFLGVTVLLFYGSSISAYRMYDIFNNALSHGGKINITFDRLLIVPENGTAPHFTESQLQKKSKYGNRNRLEDITLRIALVVCDRFFYRCTFIAPQFHYTYIYQKSCGFYSATKSKKMFVPSKCCYF